MKENGFVRQQHHRIVFIGYRYAVVTFFPFPMLHTRGKTHTHTRHQIRVTVRKAVLRSAKRRRKNKRIECAWVSVFVSLAGARCTAINQRKGNTIKKQLERSITRNAADHENRQKEWAERYTANGPGKQKESKNERRKVSTQKLDSNCPDSNV